MKKRVFMRMVNSVYRVVICTEDWSQEDVGLMGQFSEPEVNVGGDIPYCISDVNLRATNMDSDFRVKTFGDEFVRILHGFPYSRGFDSRDYESTEEAVSLGNAWKDVVLNRIDDAVIALRQNTKPLPTEEVTEI